MLKAITHNALVVYPYGGSLQSNVGQIVDLPSPSWVSIVIGKMENPWTAA